MRLFCLTAEKKGRRDYSLRPLRKTLCSLRFNLKGLTFGRDPRGMLLY